MTKRTPRRTTLSDLFRNAASPSVYTDITESAEDLLTVPDVYSVGRTISAEMHDVSPGLSLPELLKIHDLRLSVFPVGGAHVQALLKLYDPFQWPSRVCVVHGGTSLARSLGADGPFVLVYHGRGYDWIDRDMLGGDGSGETRTRLMPASVNPDI